MQRTETMPTAAERSYPLTINRLGKLLLAAFVVIGLLPWSIAHADPDPLSPIPTDASYFTFDASTGTITEYASDGPMDVVIPDEIEGTAVTAIGDKVFALRGITSVTFPPGITKIGEGAFSNNLLTSVSIPEGITVIKKEAFAVNKLTEVYLPDSVTIIEYRGFAENQIQSLNLPSQLKTIGPSAFINSQLTELIIPYGVETIDGGAFNGNQLEKLVLPDTVTYLGSTAFASNRLTKLPDNWTNLGVNGTAFSRNLLTRVIIPDDTTILGRTGLMSNPLRTIVIPASVTAIQQEALSSTPLATVTILNKTVTFHARAFENTPADMVIIGYAGSTAQTFANNNGYTFLSLAELFAFDTGTGTITGYVDDGPAIVEIPREIDGVPVTAIGDDAFANKQLTEVYIPEGVTSIGMNAFAHNAIVSVSIPESVTTIGHGAFMGNKLSQVSLPDNLTRIEPLAFMGNELQSIELPLHLTSIGDKAFEKNQLTEVHLPSGIETISTAAFLSNQLTKVTIPESVKDLASGAFAGNQITEATLLSRETAVARNAWADNQADAADLRILGHSGSPAEAYAADAGHAFAPLLGLSRKESYTFPAATAGYASASPLTVTVTKAVYGELHGVRAALSGSDSTAFELSAIGATTLDETSKQTSFTVYPQAGLPVGAYSATVSVEAVTYGIRESFDVQFEVTAAPDDGGSDPDPGSDPGSSGGSSPPSDNANNAAIVLVNGKEERAGTAATSTRNGQSVTTVTVDSKKLEEKLAAEGQGAVVAFAMDAKTDIVIGELDGQMIHNLESKLAIVKIQTGSATYTLPARQINIAALSNQIGKSVALQDIKVHIEIASTSSDTMKIIENAAARDAYTVVAPPVSFTIHASHGGVTVAVSAFTAYVERTIAIPDHVDPSKITTGVVVEPDGSTRHVPTRVVQVDGRYHAVINSLTNSTYAVVWHPIVYRDMAAHWASDAVNDMGSRMIVEGTGGGNYSPHRDITRAEFAAIIVRGLGLKAENGPDSFSDVKATDWFGSAIQTARAYGLIDGYLDGTFRPHDKITREQAMVIIAKAMKLTPLLEQLAAQSADERLQAFGDAAEVAAWAKRSADDTIQAGIVSGRSANTLAPKSNMTRAEVAAAIQRLLQKSGLI